MKDFALLLVLYFCLVIGFVLAVPLPSAKLAHKRTGDLAETNIFGGTEAAAPVLPLETASSSSDQEHPEEIENEEEEVGRPVEEPVRAPGVETSVQEEVEAAKEQEPSPVITENTAIESDEMIAENDGPELSDGSTDVQGTESNGNETAQEQESTENSSTTESTEGAIEKTSEEDPAETESTGEKEPGSTEATEEQSEEQAEEHQETSETETGKTDGTVQDTGVASETKPEQESADETGDDASEGDQTTVEQVETSNDSTEITDPASNEASDATEEQPTEMKVPEEPSSEEDETPAVQDDQQQPPQDATQQEGQVPELIESSSTGEQNDYIEDVSAYGAPAGLMLSVAGLVTIGGLTMWKRRRRFVRYRRVGSLSNASSLANSRASLNV